MSTQINPRSIGLVTCQPRKVDVYCCMADADTGEILFQKKSTYMAYDGTCAFRKRLTDLVDSVVRGLRVKDSISLTITCVPHFDDKSLDLKFDVY